MIYPGTAPRLSSHRPRAASTTASRGYGSQWRKIRAAVLAASPLCALSLPGCTGWATQVHHRDRDTSNNAAGNLLAVCGPCHRLHHTEANVC